MIWFVYQPDKLNSSLHSSLDDTILDIHNFNNAIEAIKHAKPDLIYGSATWDLMDYSFTIASKFLNIPKLAEFYSLKPTPRSQTTLVKLYTSRFFENSTPTDAIQTKKQFMRRGRFYVYKFLFLLKTMKAAKMNVLKVIENFFLIIHRNLKDYKPIFDSHFACTFHWLESEKLIEPLVNAGFEPSNLVVKGSPMFDKVFQRIHDFKPIKKNENKIRVLLITSSLFEHGFWTKEQRDNLIREIVKNISKHKGEIELTVKIHPSSEILSDYQSLINPIDSSIQIYQKEDILDFLESTDVVLSFISGNASAMIYALIARKPIVICNFYDLQDDLFLKNGLALECTKSSEIISTIHKVISLNPATEEKIEEYVKEFLYKSDGKAAERISDIIMRLVERNKKITE